MVPDWRDAAAYAPLLEADRSLLAWEWLRRNRAYREAAAGAARAGEGPQPAGVPGKVKLNPDPCPGAMNAPQRWGLHAFEPPGLAVPEARPVWCAGRHPSVLSAWAEPSLPDPDSFSLETVRRLATLIAGPAADHLLLSDGYRAVRLDVRGASLRCGPVRLSFGLSGIAGARFLLPVLRHFLGLAARGAFSDPPYPRDPRARRLILLLRAYDAIQDGADQRMIAAELLSGRAAEAGWRVKVPSLRSQVQRLVGKARSMDAGGFWDLLR